MSIPISVYPSVFTAKGKIQRNVVHDLDEALKHRWASDACFQAFTSLEDRRLGNGDEEVPALACVLPGEIDLPKEMKRKGEVNAEAWDICHTTIDRLVRAGDLPIARLYRTKSGGPRLVGIFNHPIESKQDFEAAGRSLNALLGAVLLPALTQAGLPGCGLDPGTEEWHRMWFLPNFLYSMGGSSKTGVDFRVVSSPVFSYDFVIDVDEWVACAPERSPVTGERASPVVSHPPPAPREPLPEFLVKIRRDHALEDRSLNRYLEGKHGEGTRHHEANRTVFILLHKYGEAAFGAIEIVKERFLEETAGEGREREFDDMVRGACRSAGVPCDV